MNYEFFIAKRILSGKGVSGSMSASIVRVAVAGVALGVMVMIMAISILTGFQEEIRNKIIGFGGHIQISKYDANTSYEVMPVDIHQPFYPYKGDIEGVRHIQVYATKAGIVKTDNDMEGVVLKGIGSDFDWRFFQDKLVDGKPFELRDTVKTNEVLVSKYLAKRLKLKTGDAVITYFIQDPPRVRKFRISGIYETGLEEFDKLIMLCDIGHIRKLNDWNEDEVGGFEVLINKFGDIDRLGEKFYHEVGYGLNAITIKERYPQIFDWLALQNINVFVIIVLMLLVAGINMISALLIIILERTSMIGILKAMGSQNTSIRKVFLYLAAYLVGTGMLVGNVAGILLCILQKQYGWVTLSQESYYVSEVPINISVSYLLLLNAGTLLACVGMLILPTYIITKLKPVKAIRFS